MTTSSSVSSYQNYLNNTCLNIDVDKLSLKFTNLLDNTSWSDPTSAVDLNNFAVITLVEAEECQDPLLRGFYLETAIEALNKGIELYNHPLCIAHLAVVFAMTGEFEQVTQTAFPALIDVLKSTYVDEQPISPGIVYLAPSSDFLNNRSEKLNTILQLEDGYVQALLLLSEALCKSQLVLYNSTGLRLLYLAAQLSPNFTSVNLKLGIYSIINNQWEGLLYLYRAREVEPNSPTILQALYLAYRDLGQMETANFWLNLNHERNQNKQNSLDWQWSNLELNSLITYVPFESKLLLAVEPSLSSLVTSLLLAEGDWFEREMEFWRSSIKPGMTVIDVGANVGVYTFSAAIRVGEEGCVVAVEPFSGCVRCLQETCRINELSWVKVCAGAASNQEGTAKLALYKASELNEIVDSNSQLVSASGTFEEVKCFSLDSLIEQENLSKVDFLKIDAEGHEIKVLEGSSRILTDFAPTILYENVAGNKGDNIDVANFILSKGYQLFRYQPYLQQLIPITSLEDLQGRLNLIALPNNKASALGYAVDSSQTQETEEVNLPISQTVAPYTYSPIDVFLSVGE